MCNVGFLLRCHELHYSEGDKGAGAPRVVKLNYCKITLQTKYDSVDLLYASISFSLTFKLDKQLFSDIYLFSGLHVSTSRPIHIQTLTDPLPPLSSNLFKKFLPLDCNTSVVSWLHCTLWTFLLYLIGLILPS